MSGHDKIINALVVMLKEKGYLVKNNPSTQKNNKVKFDNEFVYPDVYTYNGDNIVTGIYEVETVDSINEQSVVQWKRYSKAKCKFYLVVPASALNRTKELVNNHSISVTDYLTF